MEKVGRTGTAQRAAKAARSVSNAKEAKLAIKKVRKAASSPSAFPAITFLQFNSLRMKHHVKGVMFPEKLCPDKTLSWGALFRESEELASGQDTAGRSRQALRLRHSTSHQIAMTGENTSRRTASRARRTVRSTTCQAVASIPDMCCSGAGGVSLAIGRDIGGKGASTRVDAGEVLVTLTGFRRTELAEPGRDPIERTADALTKRAERPSLERPAGAR